MKTLLKINLLWNTILRCAVLTAGLFIFVLQANAAIGDPDIVLISGSTTFDEDTTNHTFSVRVDDVETSNTNLVLTVVSDNLTVLPPGSIVVSHNGPNYRYVRLTPAPHQNNTFDITFTLTDGDGQTDQRIVEITVTEVPDKPIMQGWMAPLSMTDKDGTTNLYESVVFTDDDQGNNIDEDLIVELSFNELELPGEFIGNNESPITFQGAPAEVTADIQALQFTPFENRVPVGDIDSVTVTIKVYDDGDAEINETGDIEVESINDPPTIAVTVSPSVIDDTHSASPFSMTLTDPDVGETFSATVVVGNDPTNRYGVVEPSTPLPSGSELDIESAVAAIRYTPYPNVVAGTQDLEFDFAVSDGHVTGVVQRVLSVNEVSDPPCISGIYDSLKRTDDATSINPFPTALIEDPDREASEPMIVSVTVSDPTFGSVVPGNTNGAPPDVSTTWLRNVEFVPTPNSVAVGETEVVTLTVRVEDDGGNIRFDNQTRVAITGINGAPVISGAPADGVVKSIRPADPRPFEGIYVSDDEITDLILTIEMDDPDKGELTSVDPGFGEVSSGYYVYTNDLIAISNLLDGLVYDVNTNYMFPAGSPGDTIFTVTVEDALENSDTVDVHIRLLEELQNFLVTHGNDDMTEGSLRYAVSQAMPGDHITFALPEYPALIRLVETNGAVTLNRHVTIKGPGADLLRISGDCDGDESPDIRVFSVNASVVMEGLTVESGTGQTGGGIYVSEDGALTMNGCVVKDCVANLWGGGIDVLGSLQMNNSLVENNQTSFEAGLGGGGVSLYTDQPCSFINTTFSGNTQSAPTGYGGGGALFDENSDPQIYFHVNIEHCTFSGNSDASTLKQASALSVITMGSDVELKNSVFADGTGRNIQLHSGEITSLGGNISDDAATVLKSGASDATELFTVPPDQVNASTINLGPLTLLEGPTMVHPLLSGSCAIDAGVASDVGDDQRGVHRLDTPDSGAYEANAVTRIAMNEILCKGGTDDFIELYVPRDSTAVNLGGYELFVNGVKHHTFAPTAIQPGNGIIISDDPALDTSGIQLVTPNVEALDLQPQGVVTLQNGAGQVVFMTSYVDNFPLLSFLTLTDKSLTLAPQFVGFALLPHAWVKAPPFGGWHSSVTGTATSPGKDTANTVFGADNATPVAINDVIEISEDLLTLIPVLDNDFDADGCDSVAVTGLPAVVSAVSAMGAEYWISTNPVTGYGEAVYFDPRTSIAFNSLPNGDEATDTFTYRIADVGACSIVSLVTTNSNTNVLVNTGTHRMTAGDEVKIYDTVNYNGTYTIVSVTEDGFVIPGPFTVPESAGSWIATDLRGASAEAEVEITIIGANDYPVATNDVFSCGEEDVLRILADPESGVVFDDAGLYPVPVTLAPGNLLANDSDIDTDDDNSSLLVIGVLDEVHTISGFSGTEGVTPVTVTSVGHGLETGDVIVISGYSGYPSYNGEQVVTVVDENSFTIPVVFVDDADVKGVWGRLDDGNRLSAVSALEAEVTLDIRVDREETHLIYNPRVSAVLNAISLGAFRVDTFYYAVIDSHDAVSIGRVDITVSGVNELPDVTPDPSSLWVLDPFITPPETLSDVLSGLTVVDAVGAASGTPDRADVRVFTDGADEAQSVVITDAWFTREIDVLEILSADLLSNDSDQDSDDVLRVSGVLDSAMGVEVTLDVNTNIQYNAAGSDVMNALAQGEQVVDYFRAVINDDHGGLVTNIVVVVVEGVNDKPFSFDDNITIDEDVEIFAFDPRAVMMTNDPSGRFSYTSADPNDYDDDINGNPRDDELWIVPTNATLSAHMAEYSLTNNLFTYHPYTSTNIPKHAIGPWGLYLDGLSATSRLDDAFAYTVSDQSFIFAENDLFRVEADGSAFVFDVLANDRNYNIRGGNLTISYVGVPDSRGEVSITDDGTTLTYTPEVNFVGDETFIYIITDPYGNIDKGRVTARVTTELYNGDLQANHDAFSVALGEEVTLDVLANDNRLPDSGDGLVITRLITNNQPHVRLVGNSIVYLQTNELVETETFSYEVAGVSDGEVRVVADVSVRIIDRLKKLPVQDDFFSVVAGGVEQQLNVTGNDYILPTVRNHEIISIDATPTGTVIIDTDNNTLRYTAVPGFVGRDVFGYTVSDNLGGTGSGTVTVYVGNPRAVGNVCTVPADVGSYSLNVLGNDMVLPGVAGSVTIDSITGSPANGSVAFNDDELIFTSNGSEGSATVTYLITDGVRTAQASVMISTVSNGLYATKDIYHVLEDSTSVSLDVLGNDRSLPASGLELTITAVGTGINAPDHGGTVVIAPGSKSLVYTPAPGFTGEETFTYTMTDTRDTDETKVIIQVVAPVIAVNDDRPAVYHEGEITGEFTLPVLYNDSFLPDHGGLFEIIGVGIGANAPDMGGTVVVSPDGQNLIYQPDTNYVGNVPYVETFTYEAGDGTDARVDGTVMVSVFPRSENRDPECNPDNFSVARNSTGNILPVLENDAVMPDTAAAWTITDISDPAFGGVVSLVGQTIIYTPAPDFVGTDTFEYDVNNGLGSTVSALVSVRVGSLLVNEDQFVVISGTADNALDVLLNEGIMPGPEFVPVIDTNVNLAVFGTVVAETNMLLYTPSSVYTGNYPYVDTLHYGVVDDSGLTQTQMVSVLVMEEDSDRSSSTITFTVEGVNDEPVLHNFNLIVPTTDKQSVAPFPTSFITDVDEWGGEPLVVHVQIDDPVKGELTNLGIFTEIAPGLYAVSNVTPATVSAAVQGLIYVPVENRITVGTIEDAVFTVSVWDPYVPAPVTDIMTVRVTPVNDPPVISGTVAGQTVYEHSQLNPFFGVTITEIDDLTLQPLTVNVSIDDPTHGVMTALGPFVDQGGGVYRAIGLTAAQASEALRDLVFDPTTDGRLFESNATEVTRLTISVDDLFVPAPVVDDITTVTSYDAWVSSSDSPWEDVRDADYGTAVGGTRDVVAVGTPGLNSGVVTIYYRDLGGLEAWGALKNIVPGGLSSSAEFGAAIAMQDDLLVVGAPRNNSNKGTVFIYRKDTGGADNWGLVNTLADVGSAENDRFGCSLAIYEDTLLVGAFNANGSGPDSGEVYVYRMDPADSNNWNYVQSLVPSDGLAGTSFGEDVAIHGDRVVVGAPDDSSVLFKAGSAYTFARASVNDPFVPVQKLFETTTSSSVFGQSVDVFEDIVVVGSPKDDYVTQGQGRVFIYRDSGPGTPWTKIKTMQRTVEETGFLYGSSVQVDRGIIVVGVPVVEIGVWRPGEVYAYGRNIGGVDNWGQLDFFEDPVMSDWSNFGFSINLEHHTLAVCTSAKLIDILSKDQLNVYRFKFNNAPVAVNQIGDQQATVLEPFELAVGPAAFGDADDGDVLSLSAEISDPWLSFDPATGVFSGIPMATGVVDVVLTATDFDWETATQAFSVTVRMPDGGIAPRVMWTALEFGAEASPTNSDGKAWAPDADPDFDDLSNDQEYVFGSDPNVFNTADHILSLTAASAGGNKVITYRRRSNDPSLTFVIQRSTDLQNWTDCTPDIVSQLMVPVTAEVEDVTVTLAVTGDTLFFRVVVFQ